MRPAVGSNAWLVEESKRLRAENLRLSAALRSLLDRYLALANSGDCGFWDAETEREVIAARAALSPTGKNPAP